MSKVLVTESNLEDIADAIRDKNNSTSTYSVGEMADAIRSIVGGGGNDSLPIGVMVPFGSETPPTNWLVCDGSAVSRTTYADLFAVIGTKYGAGDGSTTFNLPNKKGKVSVGLDTNDTDFNTIGKTGGEKKHKLTYYELPGQVVTGYCQNEDKAWSTGAWGDYSSHAYPTNVIANTDYIPADQPHNNLQPYQVDCWIIKVKMAEDTSKLEYAIFTTDIAQTVGSGYSVNLNVTSYTTTSRLSISNGKIKIGPDISKIRVSGGIFIDITTATTGSGYLWSQLRKNGYNQITSISPLVNSMYYLTGVLPTRIIPVVEGDTLELISDLTGSQGKIRAGAQDTFICVEIIE